MRRSAGGGWAGQRVEKVAAQREGGVKRWGLGESVELDAGGNKGGIESVKRREMLRCWMCGRERRRSGAKLIEETLTPPEHPLAP